MRPMNRSFVAATTLVASLLAGAAPAQYPSKPIHVIVPWPAGGTVDGVARVIGPSFSSSLGRPVVVENKAGAGGSIGQAEAAKAPPDGHTLLLVFDTHAVNHLLYKNLSYDPFRSFDHVSLLVTSPQVLAGATNFAPGSVPELVAFAKANPGRVTYATVGAGSSNHLNALLLSKRTGIEMTHVPYKGGAPHPPATGHPDRRGDAPRVRRALLGRDARAGRNAEGDPGAPLRRSDEGARRSGSARQARRARLRRRRQLARGVPRLCPRRVGEVGEGDPRLQYPGRIIQGVPMARDTKWIPQGVIPAVLLPFHEDLSIDE